MVKTKTREEAYLLHLMDCALCGKSAAPPDGVDFEKLLKLADAQQVYNMALTVLEQGNLLNESEAAQWKNYQLSDLQKTILVDNERAKICQALEAQGIDYMFLKGLVMRDYYPKLAMRQMADNDILYDASRRDDLLKMMKQRGFYLNGVSDASDDFMKHPVSMEFHRELFNPDAYFSFPLNAWKRAERVDGTHRWSISKEDNFIYALAHTYKHYLYGGSSLRAVCDHYLLTKDASYDMAYVQRMLEDFQLEAFNRTMSGLCECIFGTKEPTPEEQALYEVIIAKKATLAHHESFQPDIRDGKIKYFFARLFPNKQMMIWSYPVLEKRLYLLPFYYVWRLLTKSIHSRRKVKKELEKLKK